MQGHVTLSALHLHLCQRINGLDNRPSAVYRLWELPLQMGDTFLKLSAVCFERILQYSMEEILMAKTCLSPGCLTSHFLLDGRIALLYDSSRVPLPLNLRLLKHLRIPNTLEITGF